MSADFETPRVHRVVDRSGASSRVDADRAAGHMGSADTPLDPSHARRRQFIGRTNHLAQLRELINGCIPTLIEGEAGIGKSALLAELTASLTQDGYDVVRVYGTEATRSFALTPFGHLLPAASPTSQPGQLALELLVELTQRACTGRLVMLADDITQLDLVSVGILRQLASQRTFALVMSRRSTESTPEPIAALAERGEVFVERLAGLDRAESVALIAGLVGGRLDQAPGFDIWRLTGGNPLFLRELTLSGLDRGRLARKGTMFTLESSPTVWGRCRRNKSRPCAGSSSSAVSNPADSANSSRPRFSAASSTSTCYGSSGVQVQRLMS
jgi:predicted ATPase